MTPEGRGAAVGPREIWAMRAFHAVAALGSLAALGLVLHGILGLPFWNDELYSLNAASESWGFAMTRYILPDVHPPLYYHLLGLWSGLLGTGEGAARSLSLLPALAGVGVLWRLGTRLSLPPAPLSLATLWLLTSWMWVCFVQDARMYGLVLLGSTWLCLGFARLWARRGEVALFELWPFALGALLVSFLHYFAMALACSALLLLLLQCRARPRLWPPILLSGALCLLWSGWHLLHLASYGDWLGDTLAASAPSPVAGLLTLGTLFFPMDFQNVFGAAAWMFLTWGVLGAVYAYTLLEWRRAVRESGSWRRWAGRHAENPAWILLRGQLLLLAVFFLAITFVHAWLPVLHPRSLMAALPPLALCVGCLGSLVWSRRSWALCGLSLALACASLAAAWQGAEHRWMREQAYDLEGPRVAARRLAGDGGGTPVYCQVCSQTRRPSVGAHSLRHLGGFPPGAPVVHVSFSRDLRHMIPPFYVPVAAPWVAESLLRERGLRVEILTPDADGDWRDLHRIAFHVSEGE